MYLADPNDETLRKAMKMSLIDGNHLDPDNSFDKKEKELE